MYEIFHMYDVLMKAKEFLSRVSIHYFDSLFSLYFITFEKNYQIFFYIVRDLALSMKILQCSEFLIYFYNYKKDPRECTGNKQVIIKLISDQRIS